MAKSGQQHSKADVGGQRPAKDDKKSKVEEKSSSAGKDAKTSAKHPGKKS